MTNDPSWGHYEPPCPTCGTVQFVVTDEAAMKKAVFEHTTERRTQEEMLRQRIAELEALAKKVYSIVSEECPDERESDVTEFMYQQLVRLDRLFMSEQTLTVREEP